MSQPVPVVIGVGDIVNRSLKLEDAKEPLDLILQAVNEALKDTGLSQSSQSILRTRIDSVSIVRSWTWPYTDLPGLIASKLQVNPVYKEYSEHGGNQPGKLFDEAARRISQGQCQVALVAGGEALASLTAFAKAGQLPPPRWTKTDDKVETVFSPSSRELPQGSVNAMLGQNWAADNTGGLGKIHKIGAPIQVYPLYENGFRAHRGQSIPDNNSESAKLYAHFAEIARDYRYSWNYGKAETESTIGTVSAKNRMICFPYPLLMNAFNTVNLTAAVILTSTAVAAELGVPEQKWIYPLGGAGTRDSYDFWDRPNYHSSPCISRSIDAALASAEVTKDQIDCYDFYSCFPIVPKLACQHVGLSITSPQKPITLLGGLTSFGGAGNNYSMHALTAMTRELRRGGRKRGLVLANGGVATYQHAVILSNAARKFNSPYPSSNPLPSVISDSSIPTVDESAEGDAVIETYTVDFDRNNRPLLAHIVGRLKHNGHRFIANHGDDSTLQQISSFSTEPIGQTGFVKQDPKNTRRNLFVFTGTSRL